MRGRFLDGFVEHAKRARLNLHGIVVSQADTVLGEHHWIRDTPHELRSISKSFASCTVGIAIDEGRLTLDDKVVGFFPDDLSAGADDRIRRLTVRHLLTMAHGRDEAIMMSHQRSQIADLDWAAYFLTYPLDRSPGERFVYDSGAT